MIKEPQKGVSLVIAFLIMSVMLAIILSITTILFSQISIISNMGNSVSSFYASSSGAEKVLYMDRKMIPPGASRGFCSICSVCSSDDCKDCEPSDDCDVSPCTSCQIKYKSVFEGRTYYVDSSITPDSQNPELSNLIIKVKGD